MFLNKLRHRLMSFMLIFGGVLIFLPYVTTIAQTIESKVFPVIIDQEVSEVVRNGNEVKFIVSFNKIRDCRSVSISWVAVQGHHVYSLSVLNSVGVPALAKTHINTGKTVLGPFTAVLPDVAKRAEHIKANIFYECHIGYENRQEFARVDLAL